MISTTSRTNARRLGRRVREGKKMVEKRTVLFVDDDEIVLCSIERSFLNENELFNYLHRAAEKHLKSYNAKK